MMQSKNPGHFLASPGAPICYGMPLHTHVHHRKKSDRPYFANVGGLRLAISQRKHYAKKCHLCTGCANGGDAPPSQPLLIRYVSTMPNNPMNVLIFVEVLEIGGLRTTQSPRCFVMQTQSETNPSKGCKKVYVF